VHILHSWLAFLSYLHDCYSDFFYTRKGLHYISYSIFRAIFEWFLRVVCSVDVPENWTWLFWKLYIILLLLIQFLQNLDCKCTLICSHYPPNLKKLKCVWVIAIFLKHAIWFSLSKRIKSVAIVKVKESVQDWIYLYIATILCIHAWHRLLLQSNLAYTLVNSWNLYWWMFY